MNKTIQNMKELEDPVNFKKGDTREEITALGEGQKIRVVALALIARVGGKESCNCGLSRVADTDNHIVLVDPTLRRPSLAAGEDDSVTAEFTPRVRLDHPDLARSKLQPLITAAPNHALKVRVTGLLLFDSEHFIARHLKRHNNWEIHPVLGLEYCPKARSARHRATPTGYRLKTSRAPAAQHEAISIASRDQPRLNSVGLFDMI